MVKVNPSLNYQAHGSSTSGSVAGSLGAEQYGGATQLGDGPIECREALSRS